MTEVAPILQGIIYMMLLCFGGKRNVKSIKWKIRTIT